MDEAKEQKEQLNESAKVLYAQEQQIEAKKKVVAGFQKERLLLERKLKKRKSEADKKARPLSGTSDAFSWSAATWPANFMWLPCLCMDLSQVVTGRDVRHSTANERL